MLLCEKAPAGLLWSHSLCMRKDGRLYGRVGGSESERREEPTDGETGLKAPGSPG